MTVNIMLEMYVKQKGTPNGFVNYFHDLMLPKSEPNMSQSAQEEEERVNAGSAISSCRSDHRVKFCENIVNAIMELYDTLTKNESWTELLSPGMLVCIL